MTPFVAEQIQAVDDLHVACGETPLVLVGAMALQWHFQKWEATRDMDMSIAASVNEVSNITGRLRGWKQDLHQGHAWQSPAGVRVDILPAGPEILEAGEIVWPRTDRRSTRKSRQSLKTF
ncbi:MAG TPA: hypothetical protein VF720_06950 [Candidatus Eisenbacteria bacterium]